MIHSFIHSFMHSFIFYHFILQRVMVGNQTKPESRIYSTKLLFYLLTFSFFVSKLLHLYLTLSVLENQRKTCLESNISHFRQLPKKIKADGPTSRPCTKCWCDARLASHWHVCSVKNNPDSLLNYSKSPDLVSLHHLNPTEEKPFFDIYRDAHKIEFIS